MNLSTWKVRVFKIKKPGQFHGAKNILGSALISSFIVHAICFLYLIPFLGPPEGVQEQINQLSEGTDWWGTFLPWMAFHFSLQSVNDWQVIYFILSLINAFSLNRLLLPLWNMKPVHKFISIFFQYLFSMYVLQNGRDGIQLCLFTLALAIFLDKTSRFRVLQRQLSILLVAIACLLKLAFVPFLAFAFYLFQDKGSKKNPSLLLKRFELSVPIFVVLLAFSLNLVISEQAYKEGLQNSYPEQQVMIYDLASVQCWSSNRNAVDFATQSLLPILVNNNEARDICRYLVPYGWDTLRVTQESWGLNKPIRQINASGGETYLKLKNDWIRLIISHPLAWFSAKATLIGHILFMSHSLDNPRNKRETSNIFYYLLQLFRATSVLLDNLMLTTLGASFILLFINQFFRTSTRSLNGPFVLISICFLNQLFVYVSNNGRYVFGMILVTWLLFLRRMKLHNE